MDNNANIKIIHYCWFGGKPLSKLTLNCIESWKKYLPDFEIKQWNESNFDVNQCAFVKEAYEQKKWAFVADYTRFKILDEFGGMYLDTDMEITSDIYKYLENDLFFGKEDSNMVNAAVVWSKHPNNKHIQNILQLYEKSKVFNPTGDLFDQSVPKIITNYFMKFGFEKNSNEIQILNNDIYIYPMEYFYPLSYNHQNNMFTNNSCMIHHFDATWTSKGEQLKTKLKRKNMTWMVHIIDFFVAIKRNVTFKDITIFLIPLIIFSLALLSFWPGISTYDGNYQWNQIQNNYITDAHPFLSTFFVKILSYIWNSETIVLIFQIFAFSFIWTCICKSLRKKDSSIKLQVIYTIFTCLFPIIFVYSITLWKDVIYSYALISLTLMLYIGIKKEWKYRILDLVTISFLLIFIQSYRHNGIIVSAITLVILLVLLFKNKVSKKRIIIFGASLIVFYLMIIIPKQIIVQPSLDIMGAKEGLTIFMTGSLLKDNVEMESKDIEYLNSLMPIESWKELYTPYLINTVCLSPLLNKEKMLETYDELLRIFIKYSIKNPGSIIVHYIKADALLWSPYPLGYTYIFDFSEWGPEFYGFDAKVESKFEQGKVFFDGIINITMENKFIRNILYRPATAMYLSIAIMIYIVNKTKNKKYYFMLLPMLLNTLSYVPVNLAQDLRYLYINYLTLSFVIFILIMPKYKKTDNLLSKGKII
ncbi:MAG: glycosyltransferase [Clostridia bacterium]|nr:glycosyltransferase [Clostridia bacterium]MDD4386828.1 glycosyltransferase [Clostridia bacterium]